MTNQDNLININVPIAERIYPLRIRKEEEESIRNAARTINEKIKEYQGKYAAKDRQDFLAMIALTLAVDLQKQPVGNGSDPISIEKLRTLHEVLDQLRSS